MESSIAKLLNSASDKEKLNELLLEYLDENPDNSDDDSDRFSDDDNDDETDTDPADFDMRQSDFDNAMHRACESVEINTGNENDEQGKAEKFR
jgi:hypothetical protein